MFIYGGQVIITSCGCLQVLLVLQNVLPPLRNVMVHWVNDVSIVEVGCML